MAQLLVPALANVLGGGFLATAISQIAVGAVLSYVSQSLFAPDAASVEPATQSSRTNGTIAPQRILMGQVKTNGHDMFPPYAHAALSQPVTDDNSGQYLTLGIALSDLPIQGLLSVTLQDLEFVLGTHLVSNGHVLGDEIATGLGDEFERYRDKMWVKFYDGTQTVADPYMMTVFASHPDRPYLSDMIYSGGAYALLTVKYDQELWTNLSDIGWVCNGIKLDGSFTKNPIRLCNAIAEGLTLPSGDIYGLQMPFESSYLTPAIFASNDAGFECGLEVQIGSPDGAGRTPLDAMERLLEACAGRAWDDGGSLKITALDGGLPIAHITDDVILQTKGRIAEKSGSLRDRTNSITITYPDQDRLWALNPGETHTDLAAVTADGERLPAALTYPSIHTEDQAQTLAAMLLADAQRVRLHAFALPLSYGTLTVQDKITWTSDLHGYTAKVFRVESITRLSTHTLVTVRETDPDDFDPGTVTLIPSTPTIVVPTGPAPLVPNATFTAAAQANGSGNIRAGVTIAISSAALIADDVRWRIRVVGETETLSGSFDPQELSVFVPLSPNVDYEGAAMYVTQQRNTPWSAWSAFTTPDVRLSLSDLAQGTGGANEINNSAFLDGLSAWAIENVNGAVGGETDLQVRAPGDGWAGRTYPTLFMYQDGTETVGYADTYAKSYNADGTSDVRGFPVRPGNRYGVALQASAHRCTGELYILWYNSSGTQIGATAGATIPEGASDEFNPESWPGAWVEGEAPTGAAFGTMMFRKFGTLSGADSYLFIHKPHNFPSFSGMSEPPDYSGTGAVLFSGGHMVSNAITTREIAANTIRTENLDAANLEITETLIVQGAVYRNFIDEGTCNLDNADDIEDAVTVSGIDLQPKVLDGGVVKNPVIIDIQVTGSCDATAGAPPDQITADIILKVYDSTPTLLATYDQTKLGQATGLLQTRGAASPAVPHQVSMFLDSTFASNFEDIDHMTVTLDGQPKLGSLETASFTVLLSVQQINR